MSTNCPIRNPVRMLVMLADLLQKKWDDMTSLDKNDAQQGEVSL